MNCPKCHTSLTGIEVFCPNCGAKIEKRESSKKKMDLKKILIFSIPILILIIGIFIGIKFLSKFPKIDTNQYSKTAGEEVVSIAKDDYNRPKFIDGDFANVKISSEEDVYKALETLKNSLYFSDAKEEFKLDYKETSENINYYRFNQMYKGLEVFNNNVIVSTDKNGKILSFSGYYTPNIKIDIENKISEEEIANIIKRELDTNAEIQNCQKYILTDNRTHRLVFVVDAYSDTEFKKFTVDANEGKILSVVNNFESAAYEFTGAGIKREQDGLKPIKETVTIDEFYDLGTLKTRYRLIEPKRNIEIVDGRQLGVDATGVAMSKLFSSWTPMVGDIDGINFRYLTGENEDKEIAQIGLTTLKNFEEIYDYYLKNLNRKSYDNKGGKIIVNIGIKEKSFGKTELENAAWLSLTNQIYIGYWEGKSFAVSKDVLAHEITHGVISKTSKFAPSPKEKDSDKAYETGALNEGIADILGSLIEGKDWTINESIRTMRSLSNPNSYKFPKEKGGDYYYPDSYLKDGRTLEKFLEENDLSKVSDYDNGGVHNNSTVVGHAAYLMYKNGAFQSREQMAKVWYNSLFLMSSYSNFEDCALAVIKTAKNLGLSKSSVEIIESAFIETKMLEPKIVKLRGKVYSGETMLDGVEITVTNKKTKETIKTDNEGKFEQELSTGTYEIKASKEDFREYTTTINILGDTELSIEMASTLRHDEDTEPISCKSKNCHRFTVYYLEAGQNDKLETHKETYGIDDGTVLNPDILIGNMNKMFGKDTVKTDGENFTMTVAGFSMDFAWYYKDTDTKFNFNTPITEDVEIEMKMFGGLMDDEFFSQIQDKFKK